jgi:hypothetical protein
MLLGLHPLKWPVGVIFIATNQIVAVGEGCWQWVHRTVRCATGQCPVRHQTVSGAPPRHLVVRPWSWSTIGGFVLMWHRTVRCHTGQSGVTPDSPVPLRPSALTSELHYSLCRVDRCAQIAVAPLAHRTVRCYTGQSDEL